MFHRYMCSAIEELRVAIQLLDPKGVPQWEVFKRHGASLVEEIQTAGNRMEHALGQRETVESLEKRYKKLKTDVRKLQEARDLLLDEAEKDPANSNLKDIRDGRVESLLDSIDDWDF